jgi:lipoprotein-anchoring transpeptidase ErfK/SrfK
VAEKIGGGQPVGTVFESRRPVGLTWQGRPEAPIAHRIFWLEGLEPGLNQGGAVDSHARYIYIHGLGDELTLGRPCSRGCIHLAAADLVPLFDLVPSGTPVWIAQRPVVCRPSCPHTSDHSIISLKDCAF